MIRAALACMALTALMAGSARAQALNPDTKTTLSGECVYSILRFGISPPYESVPFTCSKAIIKTERQGNAELAVVTLAGGNTDPINFAGHLTGDTLAVQYLFFGPAPQKAHPVVDQAQARCDLIPDDHNARLLSSIVCRGAVIDRDKGVSMVIDFHPNL